MQKLGIADLDAILDLISSFEKVAGSKTLIKPTNWSWTNYYLNEEEPRYSVWGIYEEEQLRGMVCWIQSDEIRSWILTKLFVRRSTQSIEVLTKLYEHAVYSNEAQGIQQYFTATPHERAYDRLEIKARSRYNAYTEHVVEPYTLTGFANIDKDLLAFTPWPVKMVVKHFILKNEYRNRSRNDA